RLVQDFCHSVLHIPISLGAVQKVINRVSQAIVPHYEAIATLARQAPVGYIDETPWYCQNALQWLWTMTTDTVSLYLIHPQRSKDAFLALIEEWQGILVSDGYGVYTYCISSHNSAIVLSYQWFATSIRCGEPMARRRKEERRMGSASRGMVRRWGRFFSRVRHRGCPCSREGASAVPRLGGSRGRLQGPSRLGAAG